MNMPDYIAAPNDYAQVIGAIVLAEKCPDCKIWNLFMKIEQGLPFCWGCVTDRKAATEARARLLRAKLADKGIVIEHQHDWAPAQPADSDEPYWPGGQGVPL